MTIKYPWLNDAYEKLLTFDKSNHLPQAVLINGVENIGKFKLLTKFISSLMCATKNACGKCKACKKIAKNKKENLDLYVENELLIRRSFHPNIIYCQRELDKNSKKSQVIKVNQIRAFCDALSKTQKGLQIGVIIYADDMNRNAANSLLKTLEEPRDNTLIILLSHKLNSIPATILSRCHRINIVPDFSAETIKWLKKNIENSADYDMEHLINMSHGVALKVKHLIESNTLSKYQDWQNELFNIALNPDKIVNNKIFEKDEIGILYCLQNIIIEAIKLKLKNQKSALIELNSIIKKCDTKFLFLLLNDITKAISVFGSQINNVLLLDSILIVWSHITHLRKYPIIFDKWSNYE